MPRKRRSQKKRGSSSIESKPGVEEHTEDRSFGSGLDEIGFRPLGRRILVYKQRSWGKLPEMHRAIQTEPATTVMGPTDDPSGYDTRDPSWVACLVWSGLGCDQEGG
jgi:hypothetical protein